VYVRIYIIKSDPKEVVQLQSLWNVHLFNHSIGHTEKPYYLAHPMTSYWPLIAYLASKLSLIYWNVCWSIVIPRVVFIAVMKSVMRWVMHICHWIYTDCCGYAASIYLVCTMYVHSICKLALLYIISTLL
jgi:hypothetical protein